MGQSSVISDRIEDGERSHAVPFESVVPGILANLHGEVREELQAWKDRPDPGRKNAKGDIQRSFDLAADECVRSYLERAFPAGVLLSEESDERRFGAEERPPVPFCSRSRGRFGQLRSATAARGTQHSGASCRRASVTGTGPFQRGRRSSRRESDSGRTRRGCSSRQHAVKDLVGCQSFRSLRFLRAQSFRTSSAAWNAVEPRPGRAVLRVLLACPEPGGLWCHRRARGCAGSVDTGEFFGRFTCRGRGFRFGRGPERESARCSDWARATYQLDRGGKL